MLLRRLLRSGNQPNLALVRLGPVTIHGLTVVLRSPRFDDFAEWRRIRLHDQHVIEPFWVTSPLRWEERHTETHWVRECLHQRHSARAGIGLSLVVEVNGRFAGQCGIGAIDHHTGMAELGVWVDSEVARKGVGPVAACLVLDYGFGPLGLLRISAPICTENVPASRAAAKIGLLYEATMAEYFDAGGQRKDHGLWAVTADRVPTGGLTRSFISQMDAADTSMASPTEPGRSPRGEPRPLPRSKDGIIAMARFYLGSTRRLSPDRNQEMSSVRLGPSSSEPVVVLRSPQFSDFTGWREVRLRDRNLIEPHWPSSTKSWSQRHTRANWLCDFVRARRQAQIGSELTLTIDVVGTFVGQCGLYKVDMFKRTAELYVWMDARLAGRGIAATAIALLLEYAFGSLRLHRVTAAVDLDNHRAAKLMKRVGMSQEGVMVSFLDVGGRRRDHALWAIVSTFAKK